MWKRKTAGQLLQLARQELDLSIADLQRSDECIKRADALIEQQLSDESYGDNDEPLQLFKDAIWYTAQGEKHRRRAERYRRKSERR